MTDQVEDTAPVVDNSGDVSRVDLAGMFAAELASEEAPAKEQPQEQPERAEAQPDVPDEAIEEPDDDDEPAEASEDDEEQPQQAIKVPAGLTAEDQEQFKQLPPSLQQWMSERFSAQTADYTRKTQEVAERRKAYEQGYETLAHKMQAYDQILSRFTDQPLSPPDPALRETDYLAYEEQLSNYVTAKHRQELAMQERQKLAYEAQQHAKVEHNRWMGEQTQVLRQVAPHLVDGEKGFQARQEILKYGMELGASEERMHQLGALDIIVLEKAMKYDRAQKAAKTPRPASVPAPKVAAPSPSKTVRSSRQAKAIQRLDNAPTRDNLAAAFAAELASEGY